MARPIPPLNPLRSFEAAARHNSFARAAQELSVTPAAISRQVKLLEDYFGVEFFRREPSGISLTPEAMDYAKGLGKAFRQIASLTDEFRTRLVPRLPDFQAAHPHIKVRLSGGSSAPAAGSGGQADIVIRYGGPHWPGHRALLLFRDELVPVCSPDLRARQSAGTAAADPAAIAGWPLLSLEARRQDWHDWFAQAGVPMPQQRLQSFEDMAVVLELARRGLGVALVQRRYVEEELAAGSLVAVSDVVLGRELGYYALARDEGAEKSKVDAFFAWLEMVVPDPEQAYQK
jgi:DNA-binding transcriptional LysR family regulator